MQVRAQQMCAFPGDKSLGQTTVTSSKLSVPKTTSEHLLLSPVACLPAAVVLPSSSLECRLSAPERSQEIVPISFPSPA